MYSCAGFREKALRSFGESITLAREMEGTQSREILAVYTDLGAHHMLWQDYQLCSHFHYKVLNLRRTFDGWRHPDNLLTIRQLETATKFLLADSMGNDECPKLLFTLAGLWRSCEAYEHAFELYGKVPLLIREAQSHAATSDNEESNAHTQAIACRSNLGKLVLPQRRGRINVRLLFFVFAGASCGRLRIRVSAVNTQQFLKPWAGRWSLA